LIFTQIYFAVLHFNVSAWLSHHAAFKIGFLKSDKSLLYLVGNAKKSTNEVRKILVVKNKMFLGRFTVKVVAVSTPTCAFFIIKHQRHKTTFHHSFPRKRIDRFIEKRLFKEGI
jgi:hypothetical protein